jgi:Protein of unknown function (DUF1217)
VTYQPVVPLAGYAGWTFLNRTRAAQQAAFDKSGQVQRDTAYFEEKIASVATPEDLVADRRLLSVALGAFGLDGDINSKFFVQKVLEEGTSDSSALANRLSDKRYYQLAKAFGFTDLGVPNTQQSDFGEQIASAYRDRQFEIAVGDQNSDLRLAMGLSRDIGTILDNQTTDDGRWFAVMANPPVRQVIQTALGLPSSFGALDLDLQLSGFRDAAERVFGNGEVAQFNDPGVQEKLIRLFLVRSQAQQSTSTSRGQIALTLLQSIGGK